MVSKKQTLHTPIIFAVVLTVLFVRQQPSWSEPASDILELDYSSVSGKTGRESVLKVYNGGNVYYQTDGGYKYEGTKTDYSKRVISFTSSTITAEERRRLKTVLERNNFFSLKDSYSTIGFATDTGRSCIKVSKPINKTVCVEDGSGAPENYYVIIGKLIQLIDNLPKNYLRVQAKYKLKQWPYSFKIKLSELKNKYFLNEELFDYFIREIIKENALPFEDDILFLPSISCQGLPFKVFSRNEDCRFSLYPAKIIKWQTNLNVKLSDIGEDRVFIGNANYQIIKNLVENAKARYENLIVEDKIEQDTYAYRLELSLNQKIEETIRKH